jgi:hypothetical protein
LAWALIFGLLASTAFTLLVIPVVYYLLYANKPVNDAPALRQAEVGIAVSTATDVAKGAASVVLTEPGLTNIVALVELPRLGKASTLARFALIGAVLAAVVGMLAYLGGWLTPKELTPSRFVDSFEYVNGAHSGFRRTHAKGVGVEGFFESNGSGVRLSEAAVFRPGRVPVIGRFSLGGGQPYGGDDRHRRREEHSPGQ